MSSLREECGVFGIFGHKDAANLTYLGLYALQHRGQESAGIAISDGCELSVMKDLGMVSEVFDPETLYSLKGDRSIGHVRYSTTGSNNVVNAQPLVITYAKGKLALAHNGNLVNADDLKRQLEASGSVFQGTTDSEVIANLIARLGKNSIEEALVECMKRLKGAYSLALMTENELIAVRDPNGIRPLCLGKLEGAYVIASETCALDTIGATYVRDVKAGEILVINEKGLRSIITPPGKRKACVFEFIYFARPDSRIDGKSVYMVRSCFGRQLAREHPVKADLVMPIPDSGISAAIGYYLESGIEYGEGFMKNRYVGRTFIQPKQKDRDFGISLKLNAIREVLEGKSVVCIDDSIVRGTTMGKIVSKLKKAGAKEVHVRITSPPYKNPCFYGIDTPDGAKLIAQNLNVEEIRQKIGADSLGYLSLDGMLECIGLPKDNFCTACFTGEYPIKVPEQTKIDKYTLEE